MWTQHFGTPRIGFYLIIVANAGRWFLTPKPEKSRNSHSSKNAKFRSRRWKVSWSPSFLAENSRILCHYYANGKGIFCNMKDPKEDSRKWLKVQNANFHIETALSGNPILEVLSAMKLHSLLHELIQILTIFCCSVHFFRRYKRKRVSLDQLSDSYIP